MFNPSIGIGLIRTNKGGGGEFVTSATIAGVQIVSQVLTASYVGGGGSPTYQWKRGGVDIGSATASTYTLVAADSGQNITCVVSIGAANATSNTLAIITTIADLYSGMVKCYYPTLQRGAYYGSSCIRVRRSGDNSESNFGFTTSGVVDYASITAFCIAGGGTQNGYVVTFFDQSTAGLNATQSSASKQAQLVASGALMTSSSINIFDYTITNSSGDYAQTSQSLTTYTAFHYSIVSTTTAGGRRAFGNGNPAPSIVPQGGNFEGFRNSAGIISLASPNNTFLKRAWKRSGVNGELFWDGVSKGTSASLDAGTLTSTFYMLDYFAGYTNEKVRGSIVFNTAMTTAEIQAITTLLN